ncbi:formin-binding protein 1-like isoform X2 [Artemia franciscana]|uniref:Formin-binding protein 1-like n=1 Tax=Artemia franciscana TaxID=6661 RepID=A0AA88I159_ARTSF|nr:hypothetical protein QYM36_005264 [Artemia franciscana]
MSWGHELWDNYDAVCLHTQKGIDFLERYGNFMKERCVVEQEYATKLRKLSKSYQPKKKEEEDYQFTTGHAFKTILQELADQAGQHEIIAETLMTSVILEVASVVKKLRDDRKKVMTDGSRLQSALSQQLASLERAQKAYEKAHRESEKAEEAYKRADADLQLSRAELEKSKANNAIKSRLADDAKNEYAQQLQKTNELQASHYGQGMPLVFDSLQGIDRLRTESLMSFMLSSLRVERSVRPIVDKCHEGMEKAAKSILYDEDSKLVIDKLKTGLSPPEDIPFQDLSTNIDDTSVPQHLTANGHLTFSSMKEVGFSVRGTVSSGKAKHRKLLKGLFAVSKEDYSDLPPMQRKKKLQQKINEINGKILQETATRDGLMKMKGVYENNRALGDPMSIEGQLVENGQRLDKLRTDLSRYQGYMDEAEGRVVIPSPQGKSVKRSTSRLQRKSHISQGNSGSDESLSRSASDSSVSNTNVKVSAPNTPQANHSVSRSPESGIGTSRNSLPDSDPSEPDDAASLHSTVQPHGTTVEYSEAERLYTNAIAEIDDDGAIYDEFEPLPVLGTCRALYSFEATSEGSIPMVENEQLYVVELDQGDGWTRVRRFNDPEEGFVPTSYIECSLYSNV